MAETFDVVVIGAGPGGYVAAIRAAQLGMNVACIDKRPVGGGTCLNIGCIPSKALLDSSELYVQAKEHFTQHGIKVPSVELDLPAMIARKDAVVKQLTRGVNGLFRKNKIRFIQGTARLSGKRQGEKHEIVVKPAEGASDATLLAVHVLLATGSEPVALPSLPFDGKQIVSSTEALSFDTVPEHLIV